MKQVLLFGDSNTWGVDGDRYDPNVGLTHRLPPLQRYPVLLQSLLGEGYRIIEEALNARTLVVPDPYRPHRQGLAALEMLLDSHAPLDLVALHLGVNELKDRFGLNPGVIARGLRQLIDAARQSYYAFPPPKVLVIAPHPVGEDISSAVFGDEFGPAAYPKSLRLGEEYRRVAELAGCAFFDCASLKFTLSAVDRLHYAAQDHEKLAHALAPVVRSLLEER